MTTKKYEDRWYQDESVDALYSSLKESKANHPIAAIPTGGGKTAILCKLVEKILTDNFREEILIISHNQEILEQDFNGLRYYLEYDEDSDDFFEPSQIGMYSASLGIRDIKKITVASIQSIWKLPGFFKSFGVVIIDECHLINSEEEGMYRDFLSQIPANYVGLTATPYRTKHGYIHEGPNALFNCLVYDLTSMENFNRLTEEGYLCPLYSKRTSLSMNPEGVRMVAGEFSQKGLSEKLDRENITKQAVSETIKFGKKYKKWLVFAIDIDHAENIVRIFKDSGISAIAVHSRMKIDRDKVLQGFKDGKYRALVNVDMLTTGFDDPEIDLIAMMRPTNSPILHVQTTGRGLRPSPGKDHCLILDFGGNTKRLGPINDIQIQPPKEKKGGGGGPMAKECEECEFLNHLAAKECCNCGAEFPIKEKLTAQAEGHQDIVKKAFTPKEPEWKDVREIKYRIENKNGTDMFVVDYWVGFQRYQQFILLDHTGWARAKALKWVENCWDGDPDEMPTSVAELKTSYPFLKVPSRILVDLNGKHPQVTERDFSEIVVQESESEEDSEDNFEDDIPF